MDDRQLRVYAVRVAETLEKEGPEEALKHFDSVVEYYELKMPEIQKLYDWTKNRYLSDLGIFTYGMRYGVSDE